MNSFFFAILVFVFCCFLIYTTPVDASDALESQIQVETDTELIYSKSDEDKKSKRHNVVGSLNTLRLKNLYIESLVPYCSRSGNLQLSNCFWCKRSSVNGDSLIGTLFDSRSETFGFVSYNAKSSKLIIAFRGSANFQNWMTNIDVSPTNYPSQSGATVHKGFYKAYQSVKPQLSSLLKKVSKYYIKEVYVMGHSLGGALAQICIPTVRAYFKAKLIKVVTFGSPRVGNLAFANYIHHNVQEATRVTNYRDPVPHLPHRVFNGFTGNSVYYHAGREAVLHGNKITSCSHKKEQCNNMHIPSISAHLNYFGVDFNSASAYC